MSIAEKLTLIANNQERVYEAGYAEGKKDAGGSDSLWDVIQNNGNRIDYEYAFSGWKTTTITSKYPIKTISLVGTFIGCSELETVPIIIPYNANSFYECSRAFVNCYRLKSVDLDMFCTAKNNSWTSCFFSCVSLVRIKKIGVLKSHKFSYTFAGCSALEEIRFDGSIGSDISFQDSSKLTNESVQDIIEHLADLTGATTQTLTLHADVGAKLTEEQKATITSKNWTLVY